MDLIAPDFIKNPEVSLLAGLLSALLYSSRGLLRLMIAWPLVMRRWRGRDWRSQAEIEGERLASAKTVAALMIQRDFDLTETGYPAAWKHSVNEADFLDTVPIAIRSFRGKATAAEEWKMKLTAIRLGIIKGHEVRV